MRGGVTVILKFMLATCVVGITASPSQVVQASEWRINKTQGKAFVVTTRVSLKTDRLFSKPAGIQLQCFKNKPVVQFKFSDRVGSNRSANFSYRFDEKSTREGSAKFLSDYKTIVIEDRGALRQFVADLRSANKLRIRVDSLVYGDTRAEIPVQGADPAIAAAYASCPI